MLNDNNLQERYTVLVRNRYAQLSCENDTVTESYQHLMQANNEAADELIPMKQKIKRIRASKNPVVVEAREEVNAAFKQYQENPKKITKLNYKQLRKTYKQPTMTSKRKSWMA